MAKNDDVQAGDVIKFAYIDRNDDVKNAKAYVLNPDHENKVHALKLSELDSVDINQIYKAVLQFNKSKINAYQKGDISQNEYWVIDKPRDFYYNKIRSVFGGGEKVPYRTYKIPKMGNVKIVDNPIKDKLDDEIGSFIGKQVDDTDADALQKGLGIG